MNIATDYTQNIMYVNNYKYGVGEKLVIRRI
jgi:hypothetical protein